MNTSEQFPISGDLREIMLGLEIMIAFFCLEFFVLFIFRYLQRKTKKLEISNQSKGKFEKIFTQIESYLDLIQNRELSWGIFFFFLALMYLYFTIGDFFAPTIAMRRYFLFLGYISYLIGISLLSFSLEKQELNRQNVPITRMIVLTLFGVYFSALYFLSWTTYITALSLPFMLILLIEYGRSLIIKTKGIQRLAFPIYSLFTGPILLISGFLLTTDFLHPLVGWSGRLIGDLLQFAAVILFALSFYFLPSFSEFDWMTKIHGIFVIHPSGISLYSYIFSTNEIKNQYESDLTTGAIVAIKSIFQDMSNKEKSNIQAIRKENFTMLIEHGTSVICVLFAEEETITLREKLEKFCHLFEKRYENTIKNWYGNVSQFSDTEKIVERVFFSPHLNKT